MSKTRDMKFLVHEADFRMKCRKQFSTQESAWPNQVSTQRVNKSIHIRTFSLNRDI